MDRESDLFKVDRTPPREQEQPHPSLQSFAQQRPTINTHPMPQLHMAPPFRPLLPSGWTEHRAPNGQFYYYNAATGHSTWERPATVPPPPPLGPPHMSGGIVSHSFQPMPTVMSVPIQQQTFPPQQQKEPPKEKTKKEKAKVKKPIPDTKWSIVFTTEGNEFYYNSETKQSVWQIPEEIADAVKAFKETEEKNAQALHDTAGVKRKANDEEQMTSEEVKRAKGGLDNAANEGTELTEEDIAFQLQFIEEQERQEQLSTTGSGDSGDNDNSAVHEIGDEDSQTQIKDKDKEVELSPEERMLMFKSLLRDMDVSPFAMWEKELPRIIHDPRYTLIPTLKQRKELFDEYCKERVVEVRAEKLNKAKDLTAKDEYLKLLEEETSHRSHWDSFRKRFKKDPRFKNFSDDKEREKVFRKHIHELKEVEAERKRIQQKKAQEDFMKLLREMREIKPDSSWRKVKRLIDDDPRYVAVQSSSLREELFREYCQKLEAEDEEEMARKENERKQRERKEREEASLKNREAQVRSERRYQNYDRNSAKRKAMRVKSILAFQTLLTDLVRTHEVTWDGKKHNLEQDPRFYGEGLEDIDRERLFNEHIGEIYQKRLKSYHQLLSEHVKLDTTWIEIQPIIKEDPRAVRLSKNEALLEELFDKFLAKEIEIAKNEFLELLKENQFIEYRTRMVQLSENGAKDETGAEKEKVRGLTNEEIHDVLKDDNRYLVLNHMPEVRDELITEYLNSVEAPKMTVHQGRD
ncbi:peptide-binding protein [Gigaspora margarita]|uniref:Peptide-binding protein n=2 Tax=Gigaspora margarita TaxID=4874 RepID=A0A8H4EFY0_GIGMA|nr:peptide-binding protein [Gigaspora margarita]